MRTRLINKDGVVGFFVVTQRCKLVYLQNDGLEFEVETFFEVELAVLFPSAIFNVFFFYEPTLGAGTPKQIFAQIADKSHKNSSNFETAEISRRQIAVKSP